MRPKHLITFAILAVLPTIATGQSVDQLPPSIASLLNDEVLAIGFVDIEQLDEIADTFGISSDLLDPLTDFLTKTCGGKPERAVWVHNVEDFVLIPTIFVATKTSGSLTIGEPFEVAAKPSISHGVAVDGGVVFGTERAIDNVLAGASSPRPDLTIPLRKLNKSQMGFVLSPGSGTRRVIRESFPNLPTPFELVTGELLADEIHAVQFSVNSQAPVKVDLRIQGTTEKASLVVERAIDDAIALFEQKNSASAELGAANTLAAALRAMERQRNESTLSLRVSSETAGKFKDVLSSTFSSVVETQQSRQRLNDARQIMLALVNYESANGNFPGSYNVDEAGTPLLSWRVHVLPYLGEVELYNAFDLTKPWDSPQNRKLIERIPAVYQPGTKTGHARFLGVAGKGLFLDGANTRQIKEFGDGVSKTAGLVYVADDASVLWTKPDDWNADLANPYRGLNKDSNGRVLVGFLDAHAARLRHGFKPDMFATIFTINGGETTNLNGF